MKNYILVIFALFASINYAQNTFPNSGKVGIGTLSPTSLLELKSPGTTELTISGDHTGAINAGLVLKSYSTSINQRGLGMFMYDNSGKNEWFAGRPYSGSDAFVIYRRDNISNHNVLTSSLSHNSGNEITKPLFSINNKGNVGVGTKYPSNAQGWHGVLDVNGAGHSKILATSNIAGVKTGIFSHGSNWNGVVGRLGTESNHDLRLMAGYGKDQVTIKTNGNVGIGTNVPAYKLDVSSTVRVGDDNWGALIVNGKGKNDWLFNAHNDGNTFGIRTQRDNGESSWAYQVITFQRTTGNVGIGTTTPDSKLTVKGKIHTQEVKVDLAGAVAPDYVFLEDYNLKTLDEVSKHIKEKGHLPNIPSATQMEKEGVNLKEMNLKLLEKIEELTLYTIAQEKEIQKLQLQNSKIEELENKLNLLLQSK